MKSILFVSALAAIVSAGAVETAAATNLVQNGSFSQTNGPLSSLDTTDI